MIGFCVSQRTVSPNYKPFLVTVCQCSLKLATVEKERKFSRLKFVKSNGRSSVPDEHLKSLSVMDRTKFECQLALGVSD